MLLAFTGAAFAQEPAPDTVTATVKIYGWKVKFVQTHGDTLPTPPVDTTGTPTENVEGNYTFYSNGYPTSATVHDSATGALIRTLFSNETFAVDSITRHWDGLNDAGETTDGSYYIEVVSNNIQAEWQGVIGNTLSNIRGSFERIYGMSFAGSKGFAAIGYNEQQPMIYSFDTANPQVQTPILGKGPTTYYVTTDGNNVYWSALDPNDGGKHFVYVTAVSNNALVTLSGSTSTTVTFSPNYPAINLYSGNYNAAVTGLCIVGDYLFVAHRYLNQIDVLDKTTGDFVRSISMTNVREIVSDGGNLWAISGTNTVAKYLVNEDGTIGSALVTLSGLSAPLALGNGVNTIVVADGSTSQQVKAFNTITGAASWTIGTAGGYATSPDVTNNKFYFNDTRANYGSYVAYQGNGTYWVGDAGNQRSQHYDTSGNFINRIMWLPASYSTNVDHNDSTRVFSDYLEFEINYSDTLWELKKNWGYNVETAKDDQYTRLKGVNTLSNGRTYAISAGNMVELTNTGLRYTGATYGLNTQLYPDGSLYSMYQNTTGEPIGWYRNELTGFDGSNNPTYAETETVETSPNTLASDPAFRSNLTTLTSGEKTSDGAYITFDGSTLGSTDYHLGAVKDGAWLWRTARNTHTEYSGPYPTDGAYDIGNGVNDFSGSRALANGDIVIWGYHGEFWKNGQTNKWSMVYKNGQFLKTFGTSAAGQSIPEMSGNAFSASLIKSGDDMYLFHNDESYHSGVHRWKITGLNTISVQRADIYTTNEVDTLPGVDLMEGLPFNVSLPDSVNGWVRYPATDDFTDVLHKLWQVKTSVMTYDKNDVDIFARYRNDSLDRWVERELPVTEGTAKWELNGILNFTGNEGNHDEYGGVYVEVLDRFNKVIVRLADIKKFVTDGVYTRRLQVNYDTAVVGLEPDVINYFYTPQPVNIIGEGGTIKVKYGDRDTVYVGPYAFDADWSFPKKFRLFFFNVNREYERIVDVSKLRFEKSNERGEGYIPPAQQTTNAVYAAHLAVGSTLSDADTAAVRALYQGIVDAGLNNTILYLNPLIGSNEAGRTINIMDTSKYQGDFTGSWTHNSAGSTPDGASYFLPHLNPINNLSNDFYSIHAVLGGEPTGIQSPFGVKTNYEGVTSEISLVFNYDSTHSVGVYNSSDKQIVFDNPTSFEGFWTLSRNGSNLGLVKHDGEIVGTHTEVPQHTLLDGELSFGARYNMELGNPDVYSTQTFKMIIVSNPMTDDQYATFMGLVQNFFTTIGR